ncbi:MAG TPA: DinB family protein [Longimicrobium sp.]|uniref:DinB family protein n=1 Tax=Longimicrobium sp. TaxID=2029185 RepID=UPI002EDB6716
MPMQFDLTRALEVLERTPATLRALLGGLPEAWTAPNEGPETFSAFDNVGHLVHGERADWIVHARIILAQGPDRGFAPYDRFAQNRESQGKRMADLLDEFAHLRAGNLDTLRGWRLTERELALQGEHPALGTVTLRQLLSAWVVHDLGHVAQTARVLARQYRDEVGPWVAYLPVLTR